MSYVAWARVARLAIAAQVLPTLLGVFGGLIAFVATDRLEALAVAGLAFGWAIALTPASWIAVHRHRVGAGSSPFADRSGSWRAGPEWSPATPSSIVASS
jgi:hypothetical protein